MRIISGKYKGRRIVPPTHITARPTTDFAKEGLFNLLNNNVDFEGLNVLDLFAGTGSISLEFLSRGAAAVTSVDMALVQLDFMKRVAKQLQINNWLVMRSDVFTYLKRCKMKYDLVFADPPYQLDAVPLLPDEIFADGGVLTDEGMFVLEHSGNYDFADHAHFVMHRKYGSVNFSFFR